MYAFSRPVWFVVKPLFMVVRPTRRLLKRLDLIERDDPTRTWVKDPVREIVFDLDSNSLCGVGVGEPLDGLEFLGPCDGYSKSRKIGLDEDDSVESEHGDSGGSVVLDFSSIGLSISCGLDFKIEYIAFTFMELPEEPGLRCFSGKFQKDGRIVGLPELDDLHVFKTTLGEPSYASCADSWCEDDENDQDIDFTQNQLVYQTQNGTWCVFFDDHERTTMLMVMRAFRSSLEDPLVDAIRKG